MSLAKRYVIKEGHMKKPYFLTNIEKNKQKMDSSQIKVAPEDDAYFINNFEVLMQTRGFNVDRMTSEYYVSRTINLRDLPRLIGRYREVANLSYVDEAVDIIVEEMIYSDTDGDIVQLDLSDFVLEFKNEKLAEKIQEKFRKILKLMDFNDKAYQYVRDWYIDGRICFECVYDIKDNKITKDGIQDIIQHDPVFIEKFYEINTQKTLYKVKRLDYDSMGQSRLSYVDVHNNMYGENGTFEEVIVDDIMLVYIDSDLLDRTRGIHTSHLHKVLKPMNQLKILEDSILIYRLARAPERRVFFVDVGKASKTKAEAHIKEIQRDLKQKSVVNEDGELDSSKALHNIMEDYWIPRRNGSNATDVSTISGQNNLGDLGDLSYFLDKLYRGLRIPKSRMDSTGTFFYGNEGDITQEEQRFQGFIRKLRNKFRKVFVNLLRNELITTNMFTEEDWDKYKDYIKVQYSKTSYYAELMENNILKQRIDMLRTIAGDEAKILNVYFPEEWIYTKIFKYTDEDISEIKDLVKDKDVSLSDEDEETDISLSDELGGGSGGATGMGGDEDFGDEEMSDEDFGDELENDFGEEPEEEPEDIGGEEEPESEPEEEI